jgi:hypothetical protein
LIVARRSPIDFVRGFDHNAAVTKVNLDSHRFRKRQQQRLAAGLGHDFENVAGAVIAQCRHPAQPDPIAGRRREADEIVVIEFVFLGRRQLLPPREQFAPRQRRTDSSVKRAPRPSVSAP